MEELHQPSFHEIENLKYPQLPTCTPITIVCRLISLVLRICLLFLLFSVTTLPNQRIPIAASYFVLVTLSNSIPNVLFVLAGCGGLLFYMSISSRLWSFWAAMTIYRTVKTSDKSGPYPGKNMHMSNSGVHNLKLTDFCRLGNL